MAGVGLTELATLPSNEPEYEHKPLSYWLRAYEWSRDDDPRQAEVEHAIRQIGTNAIPYLLEHIRDENPEWMGSVARVVSQLPGPIYSWWSSLEHRWDRGFQAGVGLHILGPDLAPAVPRLIELMDNRYILDPVIEALASVGPAAGPGLIKVLTNQTCPEHQRGAAAWALELMGTNAAQYLPELKVALREQPDASCMVVWAIAEVATNKQAVIPVLVEALHSPRYEIKMAGAERLGNLGGLARRCVPDLERLLADQHPDIRFAVTNAIEQITSSNSDPVAVELGSGRTSGAD
jgi:HEAT repeat protein